MKYKERETKVERKKESCMVETAFARLQQFQTSKPTKRRREQAGNRRQEENEGL